MDGIGVELIGWSVEVGRIAGPGLFSDRSAWGVRSHKTDKSKECQSVPKWTNEFDSSR
jgi:hypothetical protein